MSSVYQKLNLNSLTVADNDKVNLGDTVLNNVRTISFWWQPNSDIIGSSSVFPIITRDGSGTAAGELYIYMFSDGTIGAYTRRTSFASCQTNINTWLSSTWYHIAFVMDDVTGMRMVVDGVDQTITNARTLDSGTTSGINTNICGSAEFLTDVGSFKIKNLQIWNTARTTPQIIIDKDTYYPAGTPDLKETWHFPNETGPTVTGVNGNIGIITTSNVGGVTYIDNVVRELINPPEPGPTEPKFDELQIRKVSKQLYPTGRAYNQNTGTVIESLHNALSKSESQAFEDAKGVLNHILPDNANFLEDDAALWENRLGLITNTAVSLTNRKLAIQRKMNQPGEYPARQSWDYLEQQLQDAGFSVYVHENIPEISIYDFLITNNVYQLNDNQLNDAELNQLTPNYLSLFDVIQLGTNQMGTFQLNNTVYLNKVVNNIDESKDAYFTILNNFRSTFFIGGITKGDFANVDLARKEEFRQLILKIKPVQSIGYLLINYI